MFVFFPIGCDKIQLYVSYVGGGSGLRMIDSQGVTGYNSSNHIC